MNNLPIEVLVQITSHLRMSDKLNLAITCKQLHKSLTKSTIYNTVLFKNMNQFNQAMELCKKTDFLQLVRHLYVEDMDCNAELVVALPTLFTRLRHLDWKRNLSETYDDIYSLQRFHFQDCGKTLE